MNPPPPLDESLIGTDPVRRAMPPKTARDRLWDLVCGALILATIAVAAWQVTGAPRRTATSASRAAHPASVHSWPGAVGAPVAPALASSLVTATRNTSLAPPHLTLRDSTSPLPAARASALGLAPGASIVRGKVYHTGTAPTEITIDMSGTPYCDGCHTTPPRTAFLEKNASDEVKNAVVSVSSGPPIPASARYIRPGSPSTGLHTFSYRGCLPEPLVISMSVHELLMLKNDDATLHNAHLVSELSGRSYHNISMPSVGVGRPPRPFITPDIVKIQCDLHPWEFAWVHVFDHQFHAVTNASGEFDLVGLAPGTYELTVWQRKLGLQHIRITVPASSIVEYDLLYHVP